MMRIFLFLATNVAVLVVISLVFSLLGRGGVQANGSLDLTSLLVMSAIIGFSGSLISLFLSKTMAKRSMGVQIVGQPSTPFERWLLDTVERQSGAAGIRMPEVGIFDSPDPNAFATGWNRNAALVAVSTGLLQSMTKDEVADPHNLSMFTDVDGVRMQDGNTRTLIFGIPKLVSYVSHMFTLHPGDVIFTGTPGGVGVAMKPPRRLEPGDVVRVEIERLDMIENPFVAET